MADAPDRPVDPDAVVDAVGLLELPADAKTGAALIDALGLDDTILEVNLTPNRGDCMSILGIAREVAALTGQSLTGPTLAAVQALVFSEGSAARGALLSLAYCIGLGVPFLVIALEGGGGFEYFCVYYLVCLFYVLFSSFHHILIFL